MPSQLIIPGPSILNFSIYFKPCCDDICEIPVSWHGADMPLVRQVAWSAEMIIITWAPSQHSPPCLEDLLTVDGFGR